MCEVVGSRDAEDELDPEGIEIAKHYAQVRRRHPLMDELFATVERAEAAVQDAAGVLTENESAAAWDALFFLGNAVEMAADRLADDDGAA